jgi:hypothetical protein
MSNPSRIYDAKQMAKIAALFEGVQSLIKDFEGDSISPTLDDPLYIFGLEIVIRHRDDYTIGRIGMDDFPFFELTDERYGEKGTPS